MKAANLAVSLRLFLRILPAVVPIFMVASCRAGNRQSSGAATAATSSEHQPDLVASNTAFVEYLMSLPDYKTQTRQFLERIRAKTDATNLQIWAEQLLRAHDTNQERVYLPHDRIPNFVLELDPPVEPRVIIFPKSHVAVVWGGGPGMWGLFITEKTNRIGNNPVRYTIEWEPGIEAFHDIQ